MIGFFIDLADLLGADLEVDSAFFDAALLAKGANLTFGEATLVFILPVTISALNV